jgi:hypothetical protein
VYNDQLQPSGNLQANWRTVFPIHLMVLQEDAKILHSKEAVHQVMPIKTPQMPS